PWRARVRPSHRSRRARRRRAPCTGSLLAIYRVAAFSGEVGRRWRPGLHIPWHPVSAAEPLPQIAGNLAHVTHLRPVPDPKPPARHGESSGAPATAAELERWATLLRLECVRMLAVAKSGHL